MRPLASLVREYRVLGLAALVQGALFAIVGPFEEGVGSAAFSTAWGCLGFGGLMYVFGFRRQVRREIERAVAAPIIARDRGGGTWRRAFLRIVMATLVDLAILLACFATGLLGRTPIWSMFGGIGLGMGLALLLCSRWLRGWERAHGEVLLIEPVRGLDAWRRRGSADTVSRPGRYFRGTPGAESVNSC
jgi:hypothetical protein